MTIGADNLQEVATLKELSNALMARIHKNYRMIVGINTGLIIFRYGRNHSSHHFRSLHNTSTLWISTKSMKNPFGQRRNIKSKMKPLIAGYTCSGLSSLISISTDHFAASQLLREVFITIDANMERNVQNTRVAHFIAKSKVFY